MSDGLDSLGGLVGSLIVLKVADNMLSGNRRRGTTTTTTTTSGKGKKRTTVKKTTRKIQGHPGLFDNLF